MKEFLLDAATLRRLDRVLQWYETHGSEVRGTLPSGRPAYHICLIGKATEQILSHDKGPVKPYKIEDGTLVESDRPEIDCINMSNTYFLEGDLCMVATDGYGSHVCFRTCPPPGCLEGDCCPGGMPIAAVYFYLHPAGSCCGSTDYRPFAWVSDQAEGDAHFAISFQLCEEVEEAGVFTADYYCFSGIWYGYFSWTYHLSEVLEIELGFQNCGLAFGGWEIIPDIEDPAPYCASPLFVNIAFDFCGGE